MVSKVNVKLVPRVIDLTGDVKEDEFVVCGHISIHGAAQFHQNWYDTEGFDIAVFCVECGRAYLLRVTEG